MVGYASLHPPYIFGYFIFGEIPDEKDILIIYWLKGDEKIEEKAMFVKLEKNLGGLPSVRCEAKPDLRGLGRLTYLLRAAFRKTSEVFRV
ncbi:hypothetical protein QUF80_05790 [Desulfococcaceae bacterium HSG8]|nr:hypothetical protein [Desulfococcaceae bacterium HSG8]